MIKRDGYNTSLWQDSVKPFQSSDEEEDHNDYEVIIVGGGITGLSTALLLQEEGRKCLLLEAQTLCFGTTGGTTAHLNTLLDTPYPDIRKNFSSEAASLIYEATRSSIQLIKENISKYAIDCEFEEQDAFLFAQNEEEETELKEIISASIEAGLSVTLPEGIPIPVKYTMAMQASEQGKFNPVKYVHGLARAFEQLGGRIRQNTRVTELRSLENFIVGTGEESYTCNSVIYATHIPPGVNLLHLRCLPYRSYAMAVTLKDEVYPADLTYDMADPYHYYRTHTVDGKNYLIAGGKDHKTGEEENTESCFQQLEAHLRKIFKIREITHKWSSQYFEPADGLPYIGHLPGQKKGVYVATGFGGNGMVYSGVAAMIFRSLLKKESTPLSELLSPGRIKPVAGFTNFMSHNAHVVKEFIGKLFPAEKLDELASLAPGEGKLVAYEGQKLAIYKDGSGNIHAVNPVCTHLKCEVKWNNTERSWDCPCHGARYNVDGEVITGPADKDVEKIEISVSEKHKA